METTSNGRANCTTLYDLLSVVRMLVEEGESMNFSGPTLPFILPNSTSIESKTSDDLNLQSTLDSLTRVALLRDRYINLTTTLGTIYRCNNHDEDDIMKRNELRLKVAQKNLEMKKLIDNFKRLQANLPNSKNLKEND